MKKLLLPILFTSLCECSHAQGFINLDFESASIVYVDPTDPYNHRVLLGPAFPGWQATIGGVFVSQVLYNSPTLSAVGVGLLDSGYSPAGFIEGNYMALLQSGGYTNTQTGVDASLFQGATVPTGSSSLQFKAYCPSGQFSVTMNGQTLSLSALSAGANYTLFGADISPWAGQFAELRFTMVGVTPQFDARSLYLDAINFSSSPIPEPGVLVLSALGCLFFTPRFCKKPPL